MDDLPSFHFCPRDWRKDAGVQSLDFFARGVWFEILCIMHSSERRGVLLLNGKAMPLAALSRLLGLEEDLLNQNISRLEAYGVAGRDEQTGALVSRRMVRDEKIRQIRKKAGKKGGNPVLLKQIPTKGVTTPPSKTEPIDPASRQKMLQASAKHPPRIPSSKLPTSDLAKRICALFSRRLTTEWDDPHIAAFKKLPKDALEEMPVLEAYYAAERKKGGEGHHRRDLPTLLNHFTAEVDRAKTWQSLQPKRNGISSNGNEPEGFRAWFTDIYPENSGTPWEQVPESVRSEFRMKHHP